MPDTEVAEQGALRSPVLVQGWNGHRPDHLSAIDAERRRKHG